MALEAADGRRDRLAPSMHWPQPIVTETVENDAGPVMVTVEYRIAPNEREAFLAAIQGLASVCLCSCGERHHSNRPITPKLLTAS
jgi:Transmembrane secretion effector